jgi:iron complex outermembrane receptor protein
VLVLLDGRTEYQDFLGLTVWSAIPVGLEEIDRIEVIRGPGSALYGANAMLGIVNIITRNPGTGPAATFTAGGSTGNGMRGSFVASGNKGLRYRASVGYDQADKWSRDFDDNRSDIRPNVDNTAIGLRSGRANFSAVYNFNPDLQVGVSAGLNRLYTEFYPLGALRNFYFDGLTSYAKTDVAAGPVKLKLFWNHLDSNSGPEYSAIGELTTTARVASNVFDAELSFSKDFELLGQHQLGLGVQGRLKQVDWNFIGGKQSETHAAVFVQDEWRIVNPFRVVASYRVDRHPLLDYLQSPRVSAVWIPTEGHALRAGVSTAFRAPTFLESYTSLSFPIPGVPGASALTQGNRNLKPESLTAYELGYRGDLPILGLEYDLALYQNRVENLIRVSGVRRDVDFYDPRTGTYLLGRSQFENDSESIYTARGAELGTKISALDGLDIRLSAAFQTIGANARETNAAIAREACGVCTQAPTWKVFGGVSYRSRANFDLSVDAAYNDRTTWVEREPGGAADPTSIRDVRYDLPSYVVMNARVAYRFFQDRASVALQGTQLGNTHSEHPFGNKITQRFFVTLSVTP